MMVGQYQVGNDQLFGTEYINFKCEWDPDH